MGRIWPYGFSSFEEAEDLGHQRIYCRVHKYRGWSEDTGACPYCTEATETESETDDTEEAIG